MPAGRSPLCQRIAAVLVWIAASAMPSARADDLELAPTTAAATFYTRPLVRARLRVTDSLQDYAITTITPTKDDPTRFDVDVHFRARTPFGAVTAHSAGFQMKRAGSEGGWIVTAR